MLSLFVFHLLHHAHLWFAAVEYDWTPKEPITTQSDFIRDTISYLESMFVTLQNLPVSYIDLFAMKIFIIHNVILRIQCLAQFVSKDSAGCP